MLARVPLRGLTGESFVNQDDHEGLVGESLLAKATISVCFVTFIGQSDLERFLGESVSQGDLEDRVSLC